MSDSSNPPVSEAVERDALEAVEKAAKVIDPEAFAFGFQPEKGAVQVATAPSPKRT